MSHESSDAGPLEARLPGISAVLKTTPHGSRDPRPSTYTQVIDQLGGAICGGALTPGTVITLEALESTTGASRSVIREATRVLGSLGLLRARRRLGLQVLEQSEWNHFDPQLIRWRLGSGDRDAQLRFLQEVRLAIEPEAARLAAERSSPELAGQIVSIAGRLWSVGRAGDPDAFLSEDAAFHRLVLQASGNPMFARLAGVFQEALRDRTEHELHSGGIEIEDVQLHVDLAGSIQRGNAEDAWRTSREIITRTQDA